MHLRHATIAVTALLGCTSPAPEPVDAGPAAKLEPPVRAPVAATPAPAPVPVAPPVEPVVPAPPPKADAVARELPDFKLPDVNPHSSLYRKQVSPRAFLGKATAWYFGHAT